MSKASDHRIETSEHKDSHSRTNAAGKTKPGHSLRIPSIDILRGLAVVLMVLDHSRVYFSNEPLYAGGVVPEADIANISPSLFFTIWLTHFCGPVFVFLAGMAAYLRLATQRSTREVARFLLIRGLLLVAIDLAIVPMLKWFYFDPIFFEVGPLWAIGWSMVVMSGLLFLPVGAIAVVGLVIVLGHDALNGIRAENWGAFSGLWTVLHEPGRWKLADWLSINVRWPLLPWVGVMACGFAAGELYRLSSALRRTLLAGLGANLMLTFLILRTFNLYGDPAVWESQANLGRTIMSYVNCTSQPASLCFLLMTLGPSLALLGWLEGKRTPRLEMLAALGCVPLYCYLAHWLVLHVMAVGIALVRQQPLGWLASMPSRMTGRAIGWREEYGMSLGLTLLLGLFALIVLYFSSRRYAIVKFIRRPRWASYF